MSSKIPLAFAFSKRRNRLAFDVRFVVAKSILLIITISPFSCLFFLLQILTCQFCAFTQWVKAKLDKTLLFSGWKDRVDIIFG
jgi:hypothetical protein